MAIFGSLSAVLGILFAQSSWNMDAVPVITAAQPQETETAAEIRDHGHLFGGAAERRAREALERVYRRHRAPVLIETVRSFDGAWIADVAQRRAKTGGPDRLYILVAGDERDVGVIGAQHGPASRLTDQQREAIRRSFLGPLQAGKPDEAIDRGILAIGTTLDAAAAEPSRGVRDALISAAIALAALAALVTSEVWARVRRRKVGTRVPTSTIRS